MAQKRFRRRQPRDKMRFRTPDFEAVLALPERLAYFMRLWFHLSKAEWDFALAKMRQESAYREWSKTKGHGKGRRYFAAPCDELKSVQKAVLNRFLSQVTVHFCRHGGQAGSSILTNVQHHAGFAREVFAVDIVNAFPSVFRSRVLACLKKPFEFGLRQFQGVEFSDDDREKMLNALVDLLVFKDRLPQGPPTSPRVFDIVCGKMDQELFELIQRHSTPFQSYRLTIWLDNITVSSNDVIPEEFQAEVVNTIRKQGFAVHTSPDKMIHFSPETGRTPIITGLVLAPGGVITIAPNKVNQLRGKLNRLCQQVEWDSQMRGEIAGILGFIRQVYPKGRRLPAKLRDLVENAESRFGEFSSVITAIPPPPVPIDDEPSSEVVPMAPKPKRRGKKSPPTKEVTAQEAVAA